MEVKYVNVNENIKKYYSNPMCLECEDDLCKIYGGRCKKYKRKQFIDKIFSWIKIGEKV